ncbi:MAG: hypothetical protein ACKOCQ_05905 [Candidatus Nitrosotenuis sp.]
MLKLAALVIITGLLSLSLVTAFDTIKSAEAQKVIGQKREHKFSYWLRNQVCGDEICPGSSYFAWHQNYRTFSSPYDHYTHPELLKINNG